MATKKKIGATELGWELGEVRGQINTLNKRNKALTLAFKVALEEEKLSEAGGYKITKVPKLEVSDMTQALKWAKQYPAALKVDTALAREIFRKGQSDPTKYGFEYTETERVEEVKDVDEE